MSQQFNITIALLPVSAVPDYHSLDIGCHTAVLIIQWQLTHLGLQWLVVEH
jgi:hypothetical protein